MFNIVCSEENLKTIWAKMTDWRSAQYVPSECKECIWLNRCNGGCRTSAKTIGGEWDSKEIWATAPLKILPPSNKQIELKLETQLQVNADCKYRQEDENAFVVYNVDDDIYFMVNKTYYDFITEFKENDTFTFESLQQKCNIISYNKAFYDAVLFLVQKNIFKIIV